jgi:hypothetical protein
VGYDAFLQGLEATSVATAIRENEVLFPWIECIHVLAITLVVGTISTVDLRLLGFTSLDRAVDRLTGEMLPFTWGAFIVAATTGALLFSSNAMTYGHNFFFLGKMMLIALAGINMAVFHLFVGRDVKSWGGAAQVPFAAKAAGGVSLSIWIVVVAFGRWIGFTLH